MTSTAPAAVRIVLTTLGAAADAKALARTLVEEQLAACVNILPAMTSIYQWQGEVEESSEQQLMIKTSPDRLEELKSRLLALHPYDTPELLVLDADGTEGYVHWLTEVTTR